MKKVYTQGVYDGEGESSSPQYIRWVSMLQRCYDKGSLLRDPSYAGVGVCEDWKIFSNFRDWMNSKDWDGLCLDKDLLSGKLYSPETCLFISPELNKFWTGSRSKTGGLVGTNYEKDRNKYKASIKDPRIGRSVTIGRFNTEIEAHQAYLEVKLSILPFFMERESSEVREVLKSIINGEKLNELL